MQKSINNPNQLLFQIKKIPAGILLRGTDGAVKHGECREGSPYFDLIWRAMVTHEPFKIAGTRYRATHWGVPSSSMRVIYFADAAKVEA